jgi:hypothetical protein
MAFGTLDGTDAALDISLNLGAGAVSVKCIFNYVSLDFTRGSIPRVTFCSSGWQSQFMTIMSMSGRLEGYQTKGLALSDPLSWFTKTVTAALVVTISTGCSLTASCFCNADHEGVRAFADSERGVGFIADGPVSSAWVIV